MTTGGHGDDGDSSIAAPSLAEQLRKLSDQLEEGVISCEALYAAQQALSICWEHRRLPSSCVELKDLLQRPPIHEEAEVKLLKPNDESTIVGFILCRGVANAVVKYRGDVPFKATREESHFFLADLMGMGHVVAPCIAVDLNLLGTELAPPQTILELLRQHTHLWQSGQEEHTSTTWPTNTWVTIEQCIHVNGKASKAANGINGSMKSFGNSTNQGSKAAARLANFFGCIDLLQAYAATPDGKECGEAALMRDWYREEATDADFFEVISKLDVRNVHELCALACVTLQRDGGPSNLMLQQGDSESFRLVSIDGTRVLGAFPSESLELFDKTEQMVAYTYWFPACLELPQAAEAFDNDLAVALVTLDANAVRRKLQQHLGAAPGASQARAEAEALAAYQRLQHVQQILQTGRPTARELCFQVVPTWRRDYWLDCRRALVPLHAIEEHLKAGGSPQAWEEECCERRKWNSWEPKVPQSIDQVDPVPSSFAWDFF